MANPTLASEGIDETAYIAMLRDFVEDVPVFAPTQVSSNGTSTEYRCSAAPIYDGDTNLTVTVTGVAQTKVASRSALNAANQVYIEYETGWMFWNPANPPAAGVNNIQIRSSKVRWRDGKMRQALNAGMRAMFPRVWQKKVDQSSITLAINIWDYNLPGPDWFDPRVRMLEVEHRIIPSSMERFVPHEAWRRVGMTQIQFPDSQNYPPGTQIRLTWAGPYTNMTDLEVQIMQLPLWYAKGYLLSNRETVRTRFDQANATQNDQANPPGLSQNAGAFFFNRFDVELARLEQPIPMPDILFSGAA